MYQKLLLAVDGSLSSIRATKEAIKIASLLDRGFLEAVYVVDFSKSKEEILHAANLVQLRQIRYQRILPIKKELQTLIFPYTIKFLRGDPGPTISRYANQHQFDLLIIGSRGNNRLRQFFLAVSVKR